MKYIAQLLGLILVPMTIFCVVESSKQKKEKITVTYEENKKIRIFLLEYPTKFPVSHENIGNFLNNKESLTEKIIESLTPEKLIEYYGNKDEEKIEEALEVVYNQAKQEVEENFIHSPSAQHALNIIGSGIMGGFLLYLKGKTYNEQKPDYINNLFNALISGFGVNALTSIGNIFGYNNRDKENKKIIQAYELRKKNIELAKNNMPSKKNIIRKIDDDNFDELVSINEEKNTLELDSFKQAAIKKDNVDTSNNEYPSKHYTNAQNYDDDLDKIDIENAEKTLNKIEKDVKDIKRKSSMQIFDE